MNRVHFTSLRQDWKTPKDFYAGLDAEFHFDFDPCPANPQFNGLDSRTKWGKVNFINPPYNRIKVWIETAYRKFLGGATCVLLIPSRTDTRWWHDYVMKAQEIRFVKGRLKFDGHKNSAPFPSAVVIFDRKKIILEPLPPFKGD